VNPENANHMLVSLNGVLQKPGSSFTISGATITFASNLATGDVIDFIILLGNVLDIGTPSDGVITNAKLAQDIISGETALTDIPADTDELLISDAGTLKRIDHSLIGSLVKLDTTTISSGDSSKTINPPFSSTYKSYRIIGKGINNVTDNTQLNCTLVQSDDTEQTASYYWSGVGQRGAGNAVDDGASNTSSWRIIGNSANTGQSINFDMILTFPANSGSYTSYVCTAAGRRSGGDAQMLAPGGYVNVTTAFTKLKFASSSGNLGGGVITTYGLVE